MKLFVCLHSLKFISGFTVVIDDNYFIIAITLLDLQVHVKLKKPWFSQYENLEISLQRISWKNYAF